LNIATVKFSIPSSRRKGITLHPTLKKGKVLLSFSSYYAAYIFIFGIRGSLTVGHGGMSKGLWLLISDLA
jgi:hypothetical protein